MKKTTIILLTSMILLSGCGGTIGFKLITPFGGAGFKIDTHTGSREYSIELEQQGVDAIEKHINNK